MLRDRVTLLLLLTTPVVAAEPLTNTTSQEAYVNTSEQLKSSEQENSERHQSTEATAASPEFSKNITTLLDATGITAHIPAISTLVEQTRDRHTVRCSAEATSHQNDSSYQPQHLYRQLHRILLNNVQAERLEPVLHWYNSDVGKRVVDSEKRARPDSSFEAALTLARQSPDWTRRISLIKAIEKHTGANRLGAITGVESEYGGLMLSGCIESSNTQHSLPIDRPHQNGSVNADTTADTSANTSTATDNRVNSETVMAQMLRDDKPFYEKLFYQDTLNGMIFSLQDLSLTDLTLYAQFTASTDASHVFSTLVDSIDQTLQIASTMSTTPPPRQPPTQGRTEALKPAVTTKLDQ